MSKVRGIFPLFLVTTLGIVNGIWVFGPALKDQQQQKEEEEQARKAQELARLSKEGTLETLRNAEAAANRATSTASALRGDNQSSSWWSNLGFWTGTRNTQKTTPSVNFREDKQNTTRQQDK